MNTTSIDQRIKEKAAERLNKDIEKQINLLQNSLLVKVNPLIKLGTGIPEQDFHTLVTHKITLIKELFKANIERYETEEVDNFMKKYNELIEFTKDNID